MSEFKAFSNHRSRVGAAENTLLGTSDLTTIIGPSTGRCFTASILLPELLPSTTFLLLFLYRASFDDMGNHLYTNARRCYKSAKKSTSTILMKLC